MFPGRTQPLKLAGYFGTARIGPGPTAKEQHRLTAGQYRRVTVKCRDCSTANPKPVGPRDMTLPKLVEQLEHYEVRNTDTKPAASRLREPKVFVSEGANDIRVEEKA